MELPESQQAIISSPDPRFGMFAPLRTSTTTTPAGLSLTTASTRTATLGMSTNPFSLTQLIERTLINGGSAVSGGSTFTSTFNASTRQWTFASSVVPARTSTMTLTATSHVAQTRLDGFVPVDYGYDARGRLSSITQGTRVTTFGYDADGFLSSVTDPLLRTTEFEHDALGRVTKQIFPDSREVSMSYDGVGNLSSVTPPGRPAHAMTYSPVSQMASYDPPAVTGVAAPSTSYTYDFDRRLTAINRPDGVAVSYTYDSAGRRKTISHPHDTVTFGYDSAKGTLTSVSTPNVTMTHGYDGSLRTSTAWSGGIAGSVGHTFDNRFRIATETVNGGSAVSFGYDADSLLTSAGGLTLTRGPHGMVTATSQGVVTESVTYTTFGELESRTTKVSGTDLLKLTYMRDALGRIATKTEVSSGVTAVYEYRYELVGRLDQVKKDGVVTATYTYDANGNRLTKVTGSGTESGTYDAQDRMLTYGGVTYTYNANGDLTSKTDGAGTTAYEYDALGNLRKVTPPTGSAIEYVIDGASRRAGKKVGGTLVQQFLYSSDLRIVAELNGSGAVVSRFVYGTRVNVPDYIVKGSSTYRVVTDHLGSVRRVVDTSSGTVAQAIEYDEFGVVLADSAPGFQPFGFAGGFIDAASGFLRFGARDYDARSGRWTTKDGALLEGGIGLYTYCENDPANYGDHTGYWPMAAFDPIRALASAGAAIGSWAAGAIIRVSASALDAAPVILAAGAVLPGDVGSKGLVWEPDVPGGICTDSFASPGEDAKLNYWAKKFGISREKLRRIIHKLKNASGLGGADNITIDDDGTVRGPNGEPLDNIFDED